MTGHLPMTRAKLDGEYRSVGLFVDNAKTYIQVSSGALLVSVTFSQGLTGRTDFPIKELSLWIPWLCWLAAILAGATYQYCAAKYLEALEQKNGSLYYERVEPFVLLRWGVRKPYYLYAALLGFFYAGTTWFAVTAAYQLATAGGVRASQSPVPL